MLLYLATTICLMCFLDNAHCYRILALFPHHGRSHFDMFEPILLELANKGHQVTVVSPFPQEKPVANYEDISLSSSIKTFREVLPQKGSQNLKADGLFMPRLYEFANNSCEHGLSVPEVQELIASNERYDVILAETFNSDCFLGFVHKFEAPLIGLSTSTPMPWATLRVGQPNNPAYIPDNFMKYSDKMTFAQRVMNTIMFLYHNAVYHYFYSPNDQRIARKYFGEDLPDLRQISHNTSMILLNTHYSLNLPRPNVPSIVEIAGVHIRESKPLPQAISKWLNESTHGVIYFSMGSVIEGHTHSKQKREAFINAFRQFRQRILWKWDNGVMPGKTENIMIQKWMPQRDILCHPNIKAFISHGGLFGTIEAVYCGVPVLVIPQFGDQFVNARALEANGGGLYLDYDEITDYKISEALTTLLSENFKKQVKMLSKRFRDRPLSPLDTAVYWIEYVARYNGASFMRTAAVDMPWYQYLLIDVILLLSVFLFILLFLTYITIKHICSSILGKSAYKIKVH